MAPGQTGGSRRRASCPASFHSPCALWWSTRGTTPSTRGSTPSTRGTTPSTRGSTPNTQGTTSSPGVVPQYRRHYPWYPRYYPWYPRYYPWYPRYHCPAQDQIRGRPLHGPVAFRPRTRPRANWNAQHANVSTNPNRQVQGAPAVWTPRKAASRRRPRRGTG